MPKKYIQLWMEAKFLNSNSFLIETKSCSKDENGIGEGIETTIMLEKSEEPTILWV
jgi:hypothetical protein